MSNRIQYYNTDYSVSQPMGHDPIFWFANNFEWIAKNLIRNSNSTLYPFYSNRGI